MYFIFLDSDTFCIVSFAPTQQVLQHLSMALPRCHRRGFFGNRQLKTRDGMKIEIRNRVSDEVIFSHDQENNSIKITLELAVLKKINLYGANLYGANLSGANLYGANLYVANLEQANLYGANLYEANLEQANLYGANLYGANLSGANLYGANLYGANLSEASLYEANLYEANLERANLERARITCLGDMKFIFTMQVDTWMIGFTKEMLQIGCQLHTIAEWREFTDEKIAQMDSKALALWKRWKDPMFAIIDERLKDL